MVVRVRFSRGSALSRKPGKNGRLALLAASLLTLISISLGSLGLWRLGVDLGWTGDFVFSGGLFSHWQVWIGAAAVVQYAGLRLASYARKALAQDPDELVAEKPSDPSQDRARIAASM